MYSLLGSRNLCDPPGCMAYDLQGYAPLEAQYQASQAGNTVPVPSAAVVAAVAELHTAAAAGKPGRESARLQGSSMRGCAVSWASGLRLLG